MEDSCPKKKKPRKNYFLGCFGLSLSTNQQKVFKKKQSSPFSFNKRFQRKLQSTVKTVPVDITSAVEGGAEELIGNRDVHIVRSEKKVPAEATFDVQKVPPVTGQNIHFNKFNKYFQTKNDKYQDIILKNSKSLDHNLQHSTCQKGLSRSFTTANTDYASSIAIGSPQDKHEIISRTVSLPPPNRNNKQPLAEVDEEKDTFDGNNIDAIFGMSMLMITLMIMLLWGKFCAIVCTAAWFYFLPKFRSKNEPVVIHADKYGNLDVDSKEYKKQVVLEGFLERNRRNVVGF